MALCKYKTRLFCFFLMIIIFSIMIVVTVLILTSEDKLVILEDAGFIGVDDDEMVDPSVIDSPIILWWTPFTGEKGSYRTCGTHKQRCFITSDRSLKDHQMTEVLMFYGSDFKVDDLPLPRLRRHQWALLHEESPKNNYVFDFMDALHLFNHTATFRRNSHFPLTLQYLKNFNDLTSRKYFVRVREKNKLLNKLAPIAYVQSDCDVPSDRDKFVQELRKHFAVDSYGSCLHNKDLPKHLRNPMETMDHEDFLKLMGQYKFIISFENAVCEDYITEKLWRPLIVGSIPIYFGSPTVQDWLPNEGSAIVVSDFMAMEDLVNHIKYVNSNDDEYETFMTHKLNETITNNRLVRNMKQRTWSINSDIRDHFVGHYECFVCDRVHQLNLAERNKFSQLVYKAQLDHYGCPEPHGPSIIPYTASWWSDYHRQARVEAAVMNYFVANNRNFSAAEFHDHVLKISDSQH